jgi:hypothetical protein
MTDYDDDDYEDDLDLSTLPDDELVEQMHDDLYNGLKEEVAEGTEILLERGWDVRAGSTDVSQRDESRDGNPQAAAVAIRRTHRRQDGDRHRQG